MAIVIPIPRTKKQAIFWAIVYGVIIFIGFVGWQHEQYEISKLSSFQTVDELVGFLKRDNTDSFVWSSKFTCKDFSDNLIQRAKDKGYYLQYLALSGKSLEKYQDDYGSYMGSLGYIISWGGGEGHAVCYLNIGGRKIVVEPQTDVVFEEINGRYVGLYGGGG